MFVDQFKTAQSHSFVEESFHLIENWSTRLRARYFHAPPARSHGAFWVGDTDAAGKSRHPICSASSPKDDSKLTSQVEQEAFRNTKRETPTKEEFAETCQGILVCARNNNLLVTGHVQHILKQTVFSSVFRNMKRSSATHCPNSVQRLSEAAGTGEGSVNRSQTVHRTLSAAWIASSDPPDNLMALAKASLLG